MFEQPMDLGPGTNMTTHFWEIFLMLLGAFILGYLLRYFWGAKWRNRVTELEADIESLNKKILSLEGDLALCRDERLKLKGDYAGLQSNYRNLELEYGNYKKVANTDAGLVVDVDPPNVDLNLTGDANMNVDVELPEVDASLKGGGAGLGISADLEAGSGKGDLVDSGRTPGIGFLDFGAALKPDNLQIVEGIGPKIEGLLKGASINTWGHLADSKYDDLRGILDDAGSRYRIHDPKTWPKQAGMALAGEWDELVNYQKFLGGGKDTGEGVGSGIAKIEKMATKILGIKLNKPSDLKVIEGIGPAVEKLLKSENINNWSELATTELGKLRTILESQGDRFKLCDPATWPKQARMAAEGDWEKLDEYQEYLQGGRDPS